MRGRVMCNMIEHQKAVAKSVLKKLQTLDLYAVLAGGACRDWVLDKEATDLDFYLYYNPKYPSSSLKEVLVRLFGDIDVTEVERKPNDWYDNLEEDDRKRFDKEVLSNHSFRYTSDMSISNVFEFTIDGVKCQVIFKNDLVYPENLISGFCFDICQAYSLNIDEIKTTPEFDKAVKHKIIQITGEFYSQKDAYIKKIKSKFPDYLHVGF